MTHTTHNTFAADSIEAFAFNLGAQCAQIAGAATTLHKAYTSGTPAQQRDLRVRWMIGHMAGKLGISAEKAIALREVGKGAGSTKESVKAIDRAYSDFRYYVVCAPKVRKDTTRDAIVLTKHQRAALQALDASCATKAEMKAALQAYIAAME